MRIWIFYLLILLFYWCVYLFHFCGCYFFFSASIRSGHSRCFLAVYGNNPERLSVSNHYFVAFDFTFWEDVVA